MVKNCYGLHQMQVAFGIVQHAFQNTGSMRNHNWG